MAEETLLDVDGLKVTRIFQLNGGRMEVLWEPVDRVIDEEMQYLAKISDMNVSRTQAECRNVGDPVEYMLTREGLWYGVRCMPQVWQVFMKAKGFSDNDVAEFLKKWAKSPVKALIDKVDWDLQVQRVAQSKPWEKGGK